MSKVGTSFSKTRFTPFSLIIILPLIAFLYCLMEWLFIISKPSFINEVSFGGKLLVLFNSSAMLALLSLILLIPGSIFFFLVKQKIVRTIMRLLLCVVPAFLTAAAILLLIDNITYTVFSFGVVSTKGVIRVFYLSGFILLTFAFMILFFKWSAAIHRNLKHLSRKSAVILPAAIVVLLLALVILPVLHVPVSVSAEMPIISTPMLKTKPNIILITGDGINAVDTSLYGGSIDTTPFLRQLAQSSLVAENAFSNAQGTIGSTTSILTGRDPADTRILASTDILRDEEALQHLPAILNEAGYYTVQLSYSYYADAYNVNMQQGFDFANGDSPVTNNLQLALASQLPTDYYYFLREMTKRISDRLEHVFFIKGMYNPFLQVTESPEKFNDQQKLDSLLNLLSKQDQPVFVHLHWMGTHGPKYYPDVQVFSKGEDIKTQTKYDPDFYHDSILDFDQAVKEVYQALASDGIEDSTIMVVGSDHTQRWTSARIPLLIHFPDGKYAGIIEENVQNMDIAPTLLDTLDIPQPEWMPGQSLLESIDPQRPIFLAAIPDSTRDPVTQKVVYPEIEPPEYQFGKMTLILCDHYYTLNFNKETLTAAEVSGYIGDCPVEPLEEEEALQMIVDHMQEYEFSTEELETIIP